MKKSLLLICILAYIFSNNTYYAQYTKLLDFAGSTNGSYPAYCSLVSDGTFLYGMTRNGGANNVGTIFKIMPDGTGYVKLLDFEGLTNGSVPWGSLIFDGFFLYGMTESGGTYGYGTIFKIKTDGTGYVKLIDFAGLNGSNPFGGSLISDGTFLYGMTVSGGTNYVGTIFKIKTDGTGFVKLMDFTGGTFGNNPRGSLVFDGTFLYGMTRIGGANDLGIIFKIKPDGTGLEKLMDFAGPTNGSTPFGSLIFDGTYLYGMTEGGGINDFGTIFKIMPNGTGYTKLLDFAGSTTGRFPRGDLVSDGPYLYGLTVSGGANGVGAIFKIKIDGTSFVKLHDFAINANGYNPYGTLISDGTHLYGMTEMGGSSGKGVLFKFQYCNPPIATATNTGEYCAGTTIELNATGGVDYLWNGPLSYTHTSQYPTITSSTTDMSGVYTVMVTDSAGCSSSASTILTVNPLEVYVPTIFSPDENGPSVNNTLCVFENQGCIKDMTFSIYNLWGEKVFETLDQNICWDGNYKDKPQNTGVYIYKLLITFQDNSNIVRSGNLTLVR